MNFGNLLVGIAFMSAIGAAAVYASSLLPRARAQGGRSQTGIFAVHAVAILGALVFLCGLFLAHRFEYDYVSRYSSQALSPALTLASMWAGQEGSILLWATLGAFVGLALLRQPGGLARPAMFFVSLSQAALVGLLLIRSPFLRNTAIPADGLGLNPLLEDPWMVVHPPVLFIGYAALVAPFAIAAAGLVRNDLKDWNRMAWPWALFAVVTLGAGIVLGGVWAYKTLGWGGYWGWDPVENASLVPWLVSVALVHGLLIERTMGSLTRTNLTLAMLAWVLVLGGTYLTRSGILQDFSVHSFADAGLNVPLSAFLLGSAAAGALLLARRWKAIPAGRATWSEISRESALWLGLMTVLVLAALITVGTTAPLVTALFGKPASVQAKYYEYVSVPVGIFLVLLMAFAPALRWTRQQGTSWLMALTPGIVGALLLGAALFLAGAREVGALALAATAGLALGVNAQASLRLFRRGWTYGAGYLVHVGIAVMVLGMVASAILGKSERLRLAPGVPVQSLGYTLVYRGVEQGERGEQRLRVHVGRGDWTFEAEPVLVQTPRDQGMVRRPAVDGWKDFYLAPIEIQRAASDSAEPVWLDKDHQMTIGQAHVSFTGFRMESHEDLVVFADLRVERDGRTFQASPGMRATARGSEPLPVEIEGIGPAQIARIDADHGRIALLLPHAAPSAAIALVELSTKPFINLVWVGALIALLGSALAGVRRALERRSSPARRSLSPPIRPPVSQAAS